MIYKYLKTTLVTYNTIIMEKIFTKYAEKLLNNTVLNVKDDSYRICEIEMYYYNATEHADAYTHCDPLQLENGKFYAHRFKNKTYKSGTYKCMDIAYGDAKNKTYFGILIRSLKNLKTDEFITGPCLCVNELLKHYNCKEFGEFMKSYNIDNEFVLEDKQLDHLDIYIGPRVGLGDKYLDYKLRKYRYAVDIKRIKKQKIFELLEPKVSVKN